MFCVSQKNIESYNNHISKQYSLICENNNNNTNLHQNDENDIDKCGIPS